MFLADFSSHWFFYFSDGHKTEIAIVRDYKDKPWISRFIAFAFDVNWYRKICIPKYFPKEVWITACIQVCDRKKSFNSKLYLIQVREYERKHISWVLIGQKLLSRDTGRLKKEKRH